jgi:hypothetical protein
VKVVPLSLAALLLCAAGQANAQESSALPRETPALDRLELRPYAGWALVPNSVTGPFLGADIAFRLGGAVALGLDGAVYGPFSRSPGSQPYPLNETRDSFDLDVSFYPWPARARPDAAGSFEPYLLVGLGAVQTRPVPVVDPTDRSFQYNTEIDAGLGAGVRVFVAERIAFTLEVRDLLYFERVENSTIASGSTGPSSPRNPALWYDPNTHFTNGVQMRLGVSFFALNH